MNPYGLWLSMLPGLSATQIYRLLDVFSCAKEICSLPAEQVISRAGMDERLAGKWKENRRSLCPEAAAERLAAQGIGFVCAEDEEFPEKLRQIANPPFGLYYRGALPDQKKRAVAIVGARGRSAYGQQLAERLARELACRGVQIISGLAHGIDADAHRGALAAEGSTFGVLGCGIDVCYPRENRYLYDKLPENGGLLSEYAPKTAPAPYLFPARNRIIAGLSDCLIVVEAKEKSGSLITADFALAQGREVYAVPGRVTDALSAGTNRLISQGAGVLYNIEEFLKDWDLLGVGCGLQTDFRKNALEKDEWLVYSLLDFCPTGVGTLADRSSLPLITLFDILERLEQKGFVKETVPNYYVQTV